MICKGKDKIDCKRSNDCRWIDYTRQNGKRVQYCRSVGKKSSMNNNTKECKDKNKSECKLSNDCRWVEYKRQSGKTVQYCRKRRILKTDRKNKNTSESFSHNERKEREKSIKLNVKTRRDNFKRILQLKRDDVDFLCYSYTMELLKLILLQKYNNTCFVMTDPDSDDMNFYNQSRLEHVYTKIYEGYVRCAVKSPRQLLCVPIYTSPTHVNMLFINPFTRLVEMFEPHGNFNVSIEDTLKKLVSFMNEKLPLSKRLYIDYDFSSNACPYPIRFENSGIQMFEKNALGFCCIWSLLMMEFKLLFPKKHSGHFGTMLREQYPHSKLDSWDSFIRGYTHGLVLKIRETLNLSCPDENVSTLPMKDIDKKYFMKAIHYMKIKLF